MGLLRWRKFVNGVMLTLTGLCTVLTVSTLFLILGYLVWNGASSLDWDFFTKLPLPSGQSGGGMANAIVGSGMVSQNLLEVAALERQVDDAFSGAGQASKQNAFSKQNLASGRDRRRVGSVASARLGF